MGRLSLCVLLGLTLLAVSLNDVHVKAEVGPTETECRPYIEKAIHELKTGDSDGDDDGDDSGQVDSGQTSKEKNDDDDDDDGVADANNSTETDTKEADDNSKEKDDDDTPSSEHTDEEDDSKAEGETAEKGDDDDDNSKENDQKDDEDDDNDESGGKDSGETETAEDGNDSGENETKMPDDGESDEDDTEPNDKDDDDDDNDDDDADKDDTNDTKENDDTTESGEENDEKSKEDATNEADDDDDDQHDSKEVKESDTQEDDSKENDGDDNDDDNNDDSKEDAEEVSEPIRKKRNADLETVDDNDDDDSKADSTEHNTADEDGDDDNDSHEESTTTSSEANKSQDDGDDDDNDSKEDNKSDSKPGDDDDDDDDDNDDSKEKPVSKAESSEENKSDGKADDNDDDDSKEKDDAKAESSEDNKSDGDTDEDGDSKEDDGKAQKADTEDDDDDNDDDSEETHPEDDLLLEEEIPENLRDRKHVSELLHLDEEFEQSENAQERVAEIILRDIKRIYETAIKPLEGLYKYRDLSNRHFGDPEIFSKPLILFMGPWSGGKSSIINYLTDNEFKSNSLRTGAEPSPAYFNILMHGNETEVLDGTQLAADWTFSGLQKFGQGLEDRLRGLKMPNKLLEKVNIVEIPGILEVRKQVSRLFPFNDACQWFIDRADIIVLVYDPAKLDAGPETEAILDQLKGREYQTRILLNKADTVKPEELLRVQSALIWNISPLMSSAQPPVMYTTSLWSRPYDSNSPVRLLQAQERAFLRDLRSAVDKRIENRIASARRFAVRVRNHAKMVDCYLNTYYNHKTIFGNKKRIADEIIQSPQNYHIYEGLSTLTNISRYDLPDPEVYRDFFRLNPLYEFKKLSQTCTYFRGCPINKLDVAIAYDLPELVGKYKKMAEQALAHVDSTNDTNNNKS